MLNRSFEHSYSQIFHLTPTQWNLLLAAGVSVAGLSLLRPEFFQHLALRAGRSLKNRLRGKTAGEGVEIAGTWIPDQARLRHTHIIGATGSGKTVLLEQLIYQDLARGQGALIIDPKGDRELYDRVRSFCRKIGRESDLHLLSATYPEESVLWNPCRLGNPSELQSKWFNSGVYSEPFYAKACELGLLEAFNALLQDRPDEFSLADLVRQLRVLAEASRNDHMQGLFLELQNFAQGEWGPLLGILSSEKEPRQREISLLEVTRKNEILFVDLPTEAKAVQSARIGKLLLQELMLISGLRKLYPAIKGERPFSVFVDEFDAFATESFSTFLNKGRSSHFMIHIAHQTLSDLEKVSKPFLGQILGNCNVRFTFRIDHPDDSELVSRFIGTRSIVRKTFQTENGFQTGRSSNRESQEFKIHPDKIKELLVGEGILSMKTEGVLKELRIPAPEKFRIQAKHLPVERRSSSRKGGGSFISTGESGGDDPLANYRRKPEGKGK